MVHGGLGISPNTSGAYKASTREAGKANRPALFSRRVYSTLTLPWPKYPQ